MQASMVNVDQPFRLQADDFRGQTSRASAAYLHRAPRPSGDAVHMQARLSKGNPGKDMYLLDSTPGLNRPPDGILHVNHGARGPATGRGIESTVEARVATANILETFRETFTIEIAKQYCRADRAGYSMASMYCGASISVLGGIRGMFIPIYGADTDKTCRAMYIDITGVTCYGAVDDVPFAKLHSPMVIEFTSPCPDYSLGNKNPKGELGDKGGAEFTKIPFFVRMTCPRVVFIEQVGNIVNFETEVIAVLMGLQHEGYVVHAALVSMQQYGDIENCWRLPVVAIHESLGQWAKAYRIPVGEFSDSVSYCAEDVATLDAQVPEKYKRFMADYSVKCKSSQPGHLQKVAQTAPGHGFSSRPNACYSAAGVPPKCTTYGAGRRKPLGWKEGDEHGISYMFTPQDVSRHKNLSKTVLEFYARHYWTSGLSSTLSLDAFLYKCLGNGFTMKFGLAIYESIHKTLQLAGVPFDVESSVSSNSTGMVAHVYAEPVQWKHVLEANLLKVESLMATHREDEESTRGGQHHGENLRNRIYSMVLDTGATQMLCWDEQDSFLEGKRPAKAQVLGAQEGSSFNATSRGNLLMACFLKKPQERETLMNPPRKSSVFPISARMQGSEARYLSCRVSRVKRMQIDDPRLERDSEEGKLKAVLKTAQLLECEVITAPKAEMRKQLAGFPKLWLDLKLNLDIRQWKDGRSCMWKYDDRHPKDDSKRMEIPLRWDGVKHEWLFDYIPIHRDSVAHRMLLENVHEDLLECRSEHSCRLEVGMKDQTLKQCEARLIDFANHDMLSELKHVNLPDDFEAVMEKIPKDKRIEVIYARDADDRQVRGVKQTLPDSKIRKMTEHDFHEFYGHMGSGKNCTLCYLLRGCMRFIYKVVDKYIETRMGYYWDLDILTASHRAHCGTKYYACLRDRGSKVIKAFPLVFKDDFVYQFRIWLTRIRSDPIYQVYNWKVCTVIKADNDGVWMRKSEAWLELINEFGISMDYTDADRKETNAHAERLMGIIEKTGKACMWQVGLPPTDHVDAFLAAVWLLNRFPPVAALARDPPDGDVARPLEMFTYGWYSRARINKELCRFVLPGTLVLAHLSNVRGSDVGQPKADWMVAKGMLGKQLIVYYPITKQERKITSYTVVQPPRGSHWRDLLGIEYTAPWACKPLPGDDEADRIARVTKAFVEMVMPDNLKGQLKKIRMPKTISMVRHIEEEGSATIKPPDVEKLREMLKGMQLQSEGNASGSVPESKTQPAYVVVDDPEDPAPAEEPGKDSFHEEIRQPQVLQQGAQQAEDAPEYNGEAGEAFNHTESLLPMRDRTAEKKKKKQKSHRVAAAFSGYNPSAEEVQAWIDAKAPLQLQQENPKERTSKSWTRYESYKKAKSFNEIQQLGGTRGDIYNDMKKGFLKKLTAEEVSAARAATVTGGPDGTSATGGLHHDQEDRDWSAALKEQRFTTMKVETFSKLCKRMRVPTDYQQLYHGWLMRVSQGAVTEQMVGSCRKHCNQKCKIGIEIPAPHGIIWSSMLSTFHAEQSKKNTHPNASSREMRNAEMIGCMVAKALDAYIWNEVEVIEANKTKVRAKDNIEGVIPPPKGVGGVYKIGCPERRQKFIASMVKEISALTEMGTISHLHTAEELEDKFGVNIAVKPAVPTLFVFENKPVDGDNTPENMLAKGRMCLVGTPRNMKQGVHYDSVYAATPGQDSIMLFNALVVYLKLLRQAFDVGNAYGWAAQNEKLAVEYPRGLEQYNAEGKRLYMCLHRNTYGKPDGANLWYKERDGFWLTFFNDNEKNPGWKCKQLIMEQTLFEFTYTAPQGDRVDTEPVTKVTYLLAWSDDCDMAGTDKAMMQFIEDASHARWKVKKVSADFMLGVRRTLTEDPDNGAWVLTLTQEEYIDGVVGAYKEHLAAAGWANKSPKTPVPPLSKEHPPLSLADGTPEAEWKEVDKRGYKAICGSLIWVSRFTHREISYGISMCCRVMSKPSYRAWNCCMQMVAWLRDHKTVGMRFRSDEMQHGLVSSCDASNKQDQHDSRCQHCDVLQWCGGTISMRSSKHAHAGWGSPANEYMAIRWAAVSVMKFRNLLEELGLHDVISEPTKIYVDNNTAIHWVKTGKITDGNQYLDLAYHQVREWEKMGHVIVLAIHTKDNISDIGSKPCGEEEFINFYPVLCGRVKWVIKFHRNTMTFT